MKELIKKLALITIGVVIGRVLKQKNTIKLSAFKPVNLDANQINSAFR